MTLKARQTPQELAQNAKMKSCISPIRGLTEADAIEIAEKKIAHMEASYKDWLKEQFDILKKTFKKENFDDVEDTKLLFHQAHDIKGLGATFGYFLVSDVTQCLCDLLEHAMRHTFYPKDAVMIHIQALELVLLKDIKGEEGPAEQKLIKGLQTVFEKIVKNTPKLIVPAH